MAGQRARTRKCRDARGAARAGHHDSRRRYRAHAPGRRGRRNRRAADGAALGDIISTRIAGWFDSPGGEEPRDLYHRLVAEIERPLVELALKRAGGNQVRAARMLGLNRNTLRKKITDHKIVLTKFPPA